MDGTNTTCVGLASRDSGGRLPTAWRIKLLRYRQETLTASCDPKHVDKVRGPDPSVPQLEGPLRESLIQPSTDRNSAQVTG
jgi:hypothetical protein